MTPDAWVMMFVVALNGVLSHVLPRLSRPDIFFGVTVPESFVAGPHGHAVLLRYRMIVWAWTAALLAALAARVESVPAVGETLSGKIGIIMATIMAFNFAMVIWMIRVGQGAQRTVSPAARQRIRGDATPDHAWKAGGMFYYNPDDPALWIEKRMGLGYTLNLGNSRTWLLLGMLLAPLLAAPFLL